MLEEDDEFEEFEVAVGGAVSRQPTAAKEGLWSDYWDDDDMNDDFTNQLRKEVSAAQSNMATSSGK